jgi:hypothetical protein
MIRQAWAILYWVVLMDGFGLSTLMLKNNNNKKTKNNLNFM